MMERPPHDAAAPFAAVDLGSNSFHLIVARPVDGQLHVLDRLREMVQLAAGLDDNGLLDEAAQERALACLGRFGQRLRGMAEGNVRAVGTNTLRKARNARAFLRRAERVLGHPVEVIGGREEARLIYLGVSHGLPESAEQRLVIDIGGGSTELIVGQGFAPRAMESLYMGCVSVSRGYFRDGAIDKEAMNRAELAARVELEPVAAGFREIGWGLAVGSSGTVRAIGEAVREAGWCAEGISREALGRLRAALIEAGHVNRLTFRSLRAERVAVFPGGVAILSSLFEDLGIEHLRISDWALREGLLYDLLGRFHHQDVREATIAALARRYDIDPLQAERVEQTLGDCLAQAGDAWGLDGETIRQLAGWAARLHEIGLALAHSQYHKHGAYILENADLPGFSRQEQRHLAVLVRGHRRKLPVALFKEIEEGECYLRLCVLLRLAVLLHRARLAIALPPLRLEAGKRSLRLRFPAGWLESHPLTQADLAQEAAYLKAGDIRLSFA